MNLKWMYIYLGGRPSSLVIPDVLADVVDLKLSKYSMKIFPFVRLLLFSFSNGEHLPVGVPTNSSPINGEGRGCDVSPRTASLDRLNFMSNEDHSRQSPEVNHRSPLKPTGKEAELAAALKKSRRRSGSSPGNAGTV